MSSDKADTSAVRTDPILIVPEAGDQLLSGLEAVAEVSAQFPEAAPVEASDVMERMELSGLAQVYICPWCDSVFRSERERSDHERPWRKWLLILLVCERAGEGAE